MKVTHITWQQITRRITAMKCANHGKRVYGVPRGGTIIAGLMGNVVDDPKNADIIVDDILDSGTTYKRWKARFPKKKFIVAFNRNEFPQNAWIEFPWEVEETQYELDDQAKRLAIMLDADYETALSKINLLIKQINNENKS